MEEYVRYINSDLQYMSQFHYERVFWHSFRNERRTLDGAFPIPPFMFLPRAIPIELKGIAT